MKKIILTSLALLLTVSISFASSPDKQKIKDVINKAYVEGIHNHGSINDIRNGFHPEFEMFVLRNGNLSKVSIESWIKRIENSRKSNPTPPTVKVEANFLSINVTNNVASAQFELKRGGKTLFTDYMFLYKVGGEWKIVSKVYYGH